MNRIAHKILKARFNKLEEEFSLDKSELISIINREDPRLTSENAIFYGNYSIMGGIYKEANDTADDIRLFSVEFAAFSNIELSNGGTTNVMAAVATPIIIDKENRNNCKLSDIHYVTITHNDNYIQEIHKFEKTPTFRGLALNYIAPSFADAYQSLIA